MNSEKHCKKIEKLPFDKGFVKKIEQRVASTIKKYRLINPADKVLVAASGGKDSTTLLYILKKLGYNVEAATINVHIGCYTKQNLNRVKRFCKKIGIKLHIIDFKKVCGASLDYFNKQLRNKGIKLGPCTICGVLKRKLLNQLARKLGATKLATGHTLDDVAQSVFLNLLKNRLEINTHLGPNSGVISKNFVPRIKPLYFVSESETTTYSKMHGFDVYYQRCPRSFASTRHQLRRFFASYANPDAKANLINWFVKTLPKLKKKYSHKKILSCTTCGEPSSSKVCRACQILALLKFNKELISA